MGFKKYPPRCWCGEYEHRIYEIIEEEFMKQPNWEDGPLSQRSIIEAFERDKTSQGTHVWHELYRRGDAYPLYQRCCDNHRKHCDNFLISML